MYLIINRYIAKSILMLQDTAALSVVVNNLHTYVYLWQTLFISNSL